MKLLTKTTLLIVTISIIIIYAGNILFFHLTKQVIEKQIDNELKDQMHKIATIFDRAENMDNYFFLNYQVELEPVQAGMSVKPTLLDTVLYNQTRQKYVPHRALKFTQELNNKNHRLIIYKSLLASDKLLKRIATASIILVTLFGIFIYVLNRHIFEKIWGPFFKNLQKLEQYDIKNEETLTLESSEIDEFEKLNKVHQKMVNRIQQDFLNLKELTAKTSHELQTPLAVIKGKAELLMQSDNLGENEINTVHTILQTTERLSRLNQSLLMIFKIENNQYDEISELDLKDILNRFLENYQVLLDAGSYQLSFDIESFTVKMNPVLADVLLSNVLKNAVVHGKENGSLSVSLKNGVLKVCNSGEPLKIPDRDIFKRFTKKPGSSKGTGLGLEIVNKICQYYAIPVQYSYTNGQHCFTLNFETVAVV